MHVLPVSTKHAGSPRRVCPEIRWICASVGITCARFGCGAARRFVTPSVIACPGRRLCVSAEDSAREGVSFGAGVAAEVGTCSGVKRMTGLAVVFCATETKGNCVAVATNGAGVAAEEVLAGECAGELVGLVLLEVFVALLTVLVALLIALFEAVSDTR